MSRDSSNQKWSHLALERDRLKDLSVAVLYGGSSSEREISLISGQAVLESLAQLECDKPKEVFPVLWNENGTWSWNGEDYAPASLCQHLPKNTVFLIALHGGDGEGGAVQGFLDVAGFAYTGAGVAASALCLDKVRSREVFAANGLTVAPGISFAPKETERHPAALWKQVQSLGPGPFFLKPSLGGSSVTMSRVNSEAEWNAALARFTQWLPGERLLVEQGIPGIEITVGVMDAHASACGPVVLPAVEICPQTQGWFDHEEKYSRAGALEHCPPQNLSPEQADAATDAAATAWMAAGLTSYARIDMMVPDSGAPVVLEANTLPGFTARSLFPMAAKEAGMSFAELCLELVLHASVKNA